MTGRHLACQKPATVTEDLLLRIQLNLELLQKRPCNQRPSSPSMGVGDFVVMPVMFAGMGCLIIITGIPVYVICVKWKNKPKSFTRSICMCRIFCLFLFIIMAAHHQLPVPGHTGHYVLLWVFLFLFFCHLILEVTSPIVTKLCIMFDGDPHF